MSYLSDYETIEEMLARARAAGMVSLATEIIGDAPALGPLAAGVRARARLVTADGRVYERTGTARLGDSRGPEPLPPAADTDVEDRAERRAARAAIRTAFPDAEVAEGQQPAHIRQAQTVVRQAAKAMGVDRDVVALRVHRKYDVASVNDLTPEQVDDLVEWLSPWITGEE